MNLSDYDGKTLFKRVVESPWPEDMKDKKKSKAAGGDEKEETTDSNLETKEHAAALDCSGEFTTQQYLLKVCNKQ